LRGERAEYAHPRMLFLYNLPDWLMAAVIIGTIVGLAYAGYFLVHRLGHR
jgi:hypothetical protein